MRGNTTLSSELWKSGKGYWSTFELYPEGTGSTFYVFRVSWTMFCNKYMFKIKLHVLQYKRDLMLLDTVVCPRVVILAQGRMSSANSTVPRTNNSANIKSIIY